MRCPGFAIAALITLGSAVLAAAPSAAETSYPTRPIRLIVPYAAGGGTDFFARLAAGAMGTDLGQQIVVENRPGAGTNIGADAVAHAAPDGYTLLLGDTSTFASNPSLYQKLPYDPQKDFSPISLTGRFAIVLLVNTDKLKVASVPELVDLAKAASGGLDYASAGVGSPFHLAAELFAERAGIKLNHVPYRGAAPAVQDLAAGHVGMMFVDYATARSQLALPNIKAIGVASAAEFYGLPGVRPIAFDYPGFEAWAWQGFVAPAGTPADVIAKLHDTYRDLAEKAEFRDKLKTAGIDLLLSSPKEMGDYMRDETAKWEKVVRAADIHLE
jgi:tripartite-type tricarboxylate transporter receptor subunit TctC